MTIKSISFENYKAFAGEQTLKLKPITILIGKNSSGKSAIAKLFTLLSNSMSKQITEPLRFSNEKVELGGDFQDLVYNRRPNMPIHFSISFSDETKLRVGIIKQSETNPVLKIYSWEYNENQYTYTFNENIYTNKNSEKIRINFNGFIPVEIFDEGQTAMPCNFEFPTLNVDYIGPFRVLPERAYILTGQLSYPKTGVKGENAYTMLAVSKLLDDTLYQSVGDWYEQHFDGWRLNIVTEPKKPYIELTLNKNDVEVNLVDVGQGMNQALPLIVRAKKQIEDSIIVLEQPELHLHPAAHGDLAELFARSAKDYKQTFVIETHSENIILRLRKLVVESDFGYTHDDLIIYWVQESDTKGQKITEITIDENGVLSDWPEGVFNENLEEIIEIRDALKRKEQNDNTHKS